ncbi:hypothetical protein [Leifsonia xyli]|uniref:hypothetical protein n=1 Tax=Leifsonia xyli TaxID=1575 RepID=UPI003D66C527
MEVVHRVDRNQVFQGLALVVGVADFVVGGVFLDPGVGGGGFSEGSEKACEGFDFGAAEPWCDIGARSLVLKTAVKRVRSSLLVMRVLMIGSSYWLVCREGTRCRSGSPARSATRQGDSVGPEGLARTAGDRIIAAGFTAHQSVEAAA